MRGRTPLLLSAFVLSHAALVSGCGGRTDEAAPIASSDIIRSKNTAAAAHASGSMKRVSTTPAPPTASAATPAPAPVPVESAAPATSASADPSVGLDDAPVNPRKSPSPSLKIGDFKVSGGLALEAVTRVVRAQFGSFRKCYDDAKKADAKLGGGMITVDFNIEKSGAATGVKKGSSTLSDAKLGACFVSAFEKLTFPAPDDNKSASVIAPITITPMHATVNGKDIAEVTADDVKVALTDAGWTDIVVATPKDAKTPITITAKKGESKLTITFVPAKRGEKDPTVGDEQNKKLVDTGVVFDDGAYLAIVVEGASGADKKAASDLYAKLVKTEELKPAAK